MKIAARDRALLLVRFDRGEEVIARLEQLCADEGIGAASLTALGSAHGVELGYYDLSNKEYITKMLDDTLEIASCVGNVGRVEDDAIVHVHGVFSDQDMRTYAGHIIQMTVAVTCEVSLTVLDTRLEREYEDSIGLKLLK